MNIRNFSIMALVVTAIMRMQTAAADNWMTKLDSDIPLTELSIPGTHDSGTGNGFQGIPAEQRGAREAQTQDATIEEQWDAGIRAFDLRPAVVERNGVKKLQIYHGVMETCLGFEEALLTIGRKLEKDKGECAIIIMRHEDNIATPIQKEWPRLMGECLNNGKLAKWLISFRPGLTLGDMRGKILIISRNEYEYGPVGAYAESWSHSDKANEQDKARIVAADGKSEQLIVQDFYDCTTPQLLERKLNTIENTLERATQTNVGTWIINHASGYTINASSDGYRDNAAKTNATIIQTLKQLKNKKKQKGIIMMDYACNDKSGTYNVMGKKLINTIVKLNFKHRRS